MSTSLTAQLAERVMRASAKLRIRGPGAGLLGALRASARDEALAGATARAQGLMEEVGRGDPRARAALAELAERTLAEMRARVRERSQDAGLPRRLFARVDGWWSAPELSEHIDDPNLSPEVRRRAMEHLDRVNGLLGTYEAFLDRVRPVLDTNRPVRILDLAAGHGGFANALCHAARERGIALEITATDLREEYLELGRRVAAEQGLPVRFVVQDALDLGNLEPRSFDVVMCTQALHHFSAGSVAVMIAEARRVAAESVLFIDGSRSMLHALPIYAFLRGPYRDPILAHDAVVSCRRFFTPEELELLARLVAGDDEVDVRWMPPTHCALRITPEAGRAPQD